MAGKQSFMSSALYQYLLTNSVREKDILCELREKTLTMPGAVMQIAPEQGQFMGFLAQLIGANKTLDIGTFTGYSALVVAMALPENGQVISCDMDPHCTKVAQEYWQLAGMDHKIQLKLQPALDTLQELLDDDQQGSFDFIFIDADKCAYKDYYEHGLNLLSQKGIMLIDNVLWSGKVADEQVQDKQTNALREFNSYVLHDQRVDISMLPVADGLTLIRHK